MLEIYLDFFVHLPFSLAPVPCPGPSPRWVHVSWYLGVGSRRANGSPHIIAIISIHQVWWRKDSFLDVERTCRSQYLTIFFAMQDEKLVRFRTLERHTHGVSYLAWSHDDSHLIVCGTDDCSELWIWHMEVKQLQVIPITYPWQYWQPLCFLLHCDSHWQVDRIMRLRFAEQCGYDLQSKTVKR